MARAQAKIRIALDGVMIRKSGWVVSVLIAGAATLAHAAGPDTGWTSVGGGPANLRYSDLSQINERTVGGLRVAYTMQLGSVGPQESSPLVIGDTLYVASSSGPKNVLALDARTGLVKWQYHSEVPDDVEDYVCCGPVTRGVAYGEGKIFVGRLDGLLVALDAGTGRELWKSKIVNYRDGATVTSPPLYAHGVLVSGFAGGELGIRGALVGFDAGSGKELWRTYLTALRNEPNGDTWKGDSAEHGGGDAWNIGSYDERTDTVVWGTGNPAPRNSLVRGTGTADWGKYSNLYTAGTIALDRATGRIKWFIQHTPADSWDFDSTSEAVLADLVIGGETVPAYLKADKNGFFFVANRETGKLISADPFVNVTWATRFDVARGVPVVDADMVPTKDHDVVGACPTSQGGKDWQPMAYDPILRLAFIPANNLCTDLRNTGDIEFKRGGFHIGQEENVKQGPGGYAGEIEAWDPVGRRKVWSVKQEFPCNGGVTATAGNLVFFGDWMGRLHALDARTGVHLFAFNVGSGISAGPITFEVDGRQYIAVVAGRATPDVFGGELGKRMEAVTPQGGALVVFTLGG